MAAQYQIRVFGKQGCDKSRALNQRVDKLMEKGPYAALEKFYCDVETIDGLVAFAEAECINPSRIPAMLLMEWSAADDCYVPVVKGASAVHRAVCPKSRLYPYAGLQTDYSVTGKGVLSPKMIQTLLDDVIT